MIFALSGATWRLDYSTCTVSEMRKFLEDRAGRTLAQKSKKDALVKELKTLDRSTTVTLADLSLDIRLLVYEHLAFHPQILATSRSTYEEAKGVLSRLVTSVKLDASTSSSSTVQPKIQVNGGTWTTLPLVPTNIGGLKNSLAAWPVAVTSASQIRLHLHLDTSSILETSCMLYLLATLLADGKKREIQVHLDFSDDWSQRQEKKTLFQTLYSLTRMGKNVHVTFVKLPRATLRALARVRFHTGSTALRYFLELEEEVQAGMRLFQRAELSATSHYQALRYARQMRLPPFPSAHLGGPVFTPRGPEVFDSAFDKLFLDMIERRVGETFWRVELRQIEDNAEKILEEREQNAPRGR